MCEGHLRRPLSYHRECVSEHSSVFEHVLLLAHGVDAVAKGMPWLRGASQPADGFFLEVAVPLSFIRSDRGTQRRLPVLLTGRDSWSTGTAGPCDGWEAPAHWFPLLGACVWRKVERKKRRQEGLEWMDGVDRLEAMNYIWTQSVLGAARVPDCWLNSPCTFTNIQTVDQNKPNTHIQAQ